LASPSDDFALDLGVDLMLLLDLACLVNSGDHLLGLVGRLGYWSSGPIIFIKQNLNPVIGLRALITLKTIFFICPKLYIFVIDKNGTNN